MTVSPEIAGDAPQGAELQADDARRAREFYHYFQPDNLVQPHLRRRASILNVSDSEVPDLSKALSPIAQLSALRMRCRKAMINVMDRDIMYFLSEAMRIESNLSEETYDFVEDPILSACSSTPLKDRICELTIRLEKSAETESIPMFVINDLTKSQFASMGIIQGPPYYRFYAGVPITTKEGVNIGSLAVMDTQTREGVTPTEASFLAATAEQIMLFLQTNRQAIEGRQSRRMAEGLEAFIGGKKSIYDDRTAYPHMLKKKPKTAYGFPLPTNVQVSPVKPFGHNGSLDHADELDTSGQSSDTEDTHANVDVDIESRTHIKTFGRAANILRECFGDLGEDGAVVFLKIDTRLGNARMNNGSMSGQAAGTVNGESRLAAAKASVIAHSTQTNNTIPDKGLDEKVKVLQGDNLKELLKRYPGGRLFTLDGSASSSSEDESAFSKRYRRLSDQPRKPSRRKQLEFGALRAAFPGAGQVLFTPLWDATTGSFAYACFVATALETRSFAPSIELPFLNSFCSTLMGECSRLDTVLADKQKSDFVGKFRAFTRDCFVMRGYIVLPCHCSVINGTG